ncbi:MAG: hypothetical protein V1837_06625 [Candidatus Woesearchaeota archaeon]
MKIYLTRAKSEIDSAELLFTISTDDKLKDQFNLENNATFFSNVISQSYYSIFYCAKAMLLYAEKETSPPAVHRKTLREFRKAFIDNGLLDTKLFLLYKVMIVRAEALLEIYRQERTKRNTFTYNTIPQANLDPAKGSIANARMFYKHCNTFLLNQE